MSPVHVFHHIPKCAGNSVRVALAYRFLLVEDYRCRSTSNVETWESAESFRDRALDLAALGENDLLIGHFDVPGARLWERYPETAYPPYRRITFLRDPLERAVSEFFFAKAGRAYEVNGDTLAAHLAATENPMARWIAADPEDAPRVLDQYWFVGTVEHLKADGDRLLALLDRGPAMLPHVNGTQRPAYEVSETVIERFRRANAIDCALHDQALAAGGHLDSVEGVA